MRVISVVGILLAVTFLAAHSASSVGRLIPSIESVPAGVDLSILRLRDTDTLRVRVRAGFDASYGRSGEWSVAVPPGMSYVSGLTNARGAKRDVEGSFDLYLRCDRWGDFEITATMSAVHDSLNFVRNDYRAVVHITADSFVVRDHPYPNGFLLKQYVVDGIHYRRHGPWWLPLDPGETADIELGFDSESRLASPPTLHAESAEQATRAGRDTVFGVPIYVAVDRTGRVKLARLNVRHECIPAPIQQAALVAAQNWRFKPATSLGRPVTTLYLINVSVRAH